MSMICRKTMKPCQTESMCAPWQGCADPKDAELRRLKAANAELLEALKDVTERLNNGWLIPSGSAVHKRFRALIVEHGGGA